MDDDGYGDATYGDRIAEIYDDRYLESFAEDTTGAVSFLKELTGGGPALELGIGTGRVALPWHDQESMSRGSNPLRRWSPGCGPSPAATGSE